MKEIKTKQEYLAEQSHEQLEIYVLNADMQEDVLRDRLFLLTGCRDFGGQDGTNGSCVECCNIDPQTHQRCCLFQMASHSYLASKYAKVREKAVADMEGVTL